MSNKYFSFGAISDRGYLKKINQDNILIKIGEDDSGEFGLFAIADGMGGLHEGHVASEMVINELTNWWNGELFKLLDYSDEYLENIDNSLDRVINQANIKVLEYGYTKGERLGTTLSLMFVAKDNYIIKHIGDSRIYSLTTKIQQLTEDHSWVAEQVKSGKMTLEQAERHKNRNALTRCIGIGSDIEIFSFNGKVHRHEGFVICSDGLHKLVDDTTIYAIIKKHLDKKLVNLQNATVDLLNLVKKRGAIDNVSIIIVYQNSNGRRPWKMRNIFKRLLSKGNKEI